MSQKLTKYFQYTKFPKQLINFGTDSQTCSTCFPFRGQIVRAKSLLSSSIKAARCRIKATFFAIYVYESRRNNLLRVSFTPPHPWPYIIFLHFLSFISRFKARINLCFNLYKPHIYFTKIYEDRIHMQYMSKL